MYKRIVFLAMGVVLASCSEPEVAEAPATPRVKLYTVGTADSDRTRRFSGNVVASTEAPLSFPLSGTVAEIRADQGTAVRAGQVLARLDEDPVRIALDSARAQLAKARAGLDDAKSTHERYNSLGARGAVSRADMETATANYAAARSTVSSAASDIERLERDLANTSLTAPFDGTIAERSIEAFQEVSPGMPAFVLQTTGSLKVNVYIPENMVSEVAIGDVVDVTFPAIEGETAAGSVETIGARAESGNSFPVTVRLHDESSVVRPGMTAGVTFHLADQLQGATVYLIPISSIAIESRNGSSDDANSRVAPVFVFDEVSSTLQIRQVTIGGIRGNHLEVLEGLETGDRIVSAGVPFMREGIVVEEWRPDASLDNG